MIKKETNSVVKVDSYLIARVEKIIKKDENRFRFTNKKQFVDIAINQLLDSIKNNEEKK